MKAYTDYPFTQLGDVPYDPAPVREIDMIAYDQNKYVAIRVNHVITSIKSGYCYTQPVRLIEAIAKQLKVNKYDLDELPSKHPEFGDGNRAIPQDE